MRCFFDAFANRSPDYLFSLLLKEKIKFCIREESLKTMPLTLRTDPSRRTPPLPFELSLSLSLSFSFVSLEEIVLPLGRLHVDSSVSGRHKEEKET